ncbi:RNA-binding protein [Candidatus Bathyarchaeota archaeon]|nr:MAG: RNA-binding protein [Candidatus Bathyarchaeota archaeon]
MPIRGPPKRKRWLSVAIPASTVSDVPHLREKTYKVGLIGRALAIFRVDEIIIYCDDLGRDQRRDLNLIATILTYMETPQYLRKALFKIRPELRYAGILPPLRTPHHPVGKRVKDLKVGEPREGVSISTSKDGTLVDIGVDRPALLPNTHIPVGTRVTVRVTSVKPELKVSLTSREKINIYWGYKVTASRTTLGQAVKEGGFNLVIATSRLGEPVTAIIDRLTESWRSSKKVLVAFGAPAKGLREILAQESLSLKEFAHFTVNTIPKQATETVRTEEALYATLSIFNLIDD